MRQHYTTKQSRYKYYCIAYIIFFLFFKKKDINLVEFNNKIVISKFYTEFFLNTYIC